MCILLKMTLKLTQDYYLILFQFVKNNDPSSRKIKTITGDK